MYKRLTTHIFGLAVSFATGALNLSLISGSDDIFSKIFSLVVSLLLLTNGVFCYIQMRSIAKEIDEDNSMLWENARRAAEASNNLAKELDSVLSKNDVDDDCAFYSFPVGQN